MKKVVYSIAHLPPFKKIYIKAQGAPSCRLFRLSFYDFLMHCKFNRAIKNLMSKADIKTSEFSDRLVFWNNEYKENNLLKKLKDELAEIYVKIIRAKKIKD